MSTNETGEADYGAAVDDFLEEEREQPKPAQKEQPKPKPAAKADSKAQQQPKAEAKAEAPDEPEVEEPEAEQEEEVKDYPWKADLQQRGIDLPAVNQYLTEVIQPYITQLEQNGHPIAAMFEGDEQAAEIAIGILNGLDDNPAETVAKMITALDIDDEAINAALSGGEPVEGEQPPAEGEQPPAEGEQPEGDPNDPVYQWAQQRMQEDEQKEAEASYDAFIDELRQDFESRGEHFDDNMFSFALSATGDFEGAMQMYEWMNENYARRGEQPPAQQPPPVMGSSRKGALPPQPEKTYDGSNSGWETAFDDFFAEEGARKGARR